MQSPRLPIRHPDYRYPPSRNPYWAKLRELAGVVYSDNDTEAHAGGWRTRFPDAARRRPDRPLHVEIGCNAGHVIVEWAARDPEGAYIGLDWKFKQIFRAAEKAGKRGLGNVLFFRAHAERIQYAFGPGEIDHLYLFFPDPWPRKSQWKNRYVTQDSLKALARIVRPGGTFEIRTDHPGYFAWMEDALAGVRDLWQARERTTDRHAGYSDPSKLEIPDVTLVEKIFVRQGIRIHRLLLERTALTPPRP